LNLSFNPRFLRNLKSGGIVPSIPGGCQCARLSAVEQSDSHSRINHPERDALFFGPMALDSAREFWGRGVSRLTGPSGS
jgi:hypothetical protein